jgi:hypothetical protein
MPHVVLNGKVTIESIFDELKPFFLRNQDTILKTMEIYIERAKNAILIDSLAIEDNKKTVFLVMISGREDGFVVRLYPKIEVEKTEGVKKIIAETAKQIISAFPELKIGETNLQDYLK